MRVSWQEGMRKRQQDLENYAHDLEKKNAHLREELGCLASGFYFTTDEAFHPTSRLMRRAARALEKEAGMTNRKVYL